MELLLIRHGLPVERAVVDEPADPQLSTDGIAQAELLAAYLASERISAIYSSPLRRAVETAGPLSAAFALSTVVLDGLAEWDRNAAEYVPVEQLKARDDPRWHALLNGEWEGEETVDHFHDRVRSTVESLIVRHRGDTIAVICHGGVINSYIGHVLGLDTSRPTFFYPNYTSIHRVAAATSGERSIVTLNETAHLRGSGLPMGLFQRGG